MTLTLNGNGVSYGPFTLLPIGNCEYSVNTTVTIPPSQICPQLDNVPFSATVYSTNGTWYLTVNFSVNPGSSGINTGCNYTGCPPVYCLEVGIGYFCGSGPGGSITVELGACPTSPYNVTRSLNSSIGILQDQFYLLIFGGQCTGPGGSFPVPFPRIDYTLEGVFDGAPSGQSGQMCQTFIVLGCATFVYPGITVTVRESQGGPALASGTTDDTGTIYLSWYGKPGKYWVDYTGQSNRVVDPSGETLLLCNQTLKIPMLPADGYCCSTACLLPIKSVLNVSFSGPLGEVMATCSAAIQSGGWLYSVPDGDNGFVISGIGLGLTIFEATVCTGSSGNATELVSVDCPPSFEANYNIYGNDGSVCATATATE